MRTIHWLAGVSAGIVVLAGMTVGTANSQMYRSEEELVQSMIEGKAEWLLPNGGTYCDKSCGALRCCGGGSIEPM